MQEIDLKRFVREPALLPTAVGSGLPRVLSVRDEDGDVSIELDITPDLDCFRGHFPGQPVLPGVIQLHWAVRVASVLFALNGVPQHIKRLKFSNPILPPRRIELTLQRHGEREVQFRIQSAEQQNSQGRIVFPGPGV